MIGGAVTGSGGPALATHNAAPQENGDARPGSSRGLMSEGITEQIAELTEEARASGHKSPLKHAYASLPPGATWGDAEWGRYWDLYERAQGLQGCAYAEQIHDKSGDHDRPEHKHRVYLALTERGTLVRDGWCFAALCSRYPLYCRNTLLMLGNISKYGAAKILRQIIQLNQWFKTGLGATDT